MNSGSGGDSVLSELTLKLREKLGLLMAGDIHEYHVWMTTPTELLLKTIEERLARVRGEYLWESAD